MSDSNRDLRERDERIASGDPSPSRDPWVALRRHTPARIALGRVGASLPTAELLEFSMAHARARDAVHLPFDTEALATSLEQVAFSAQCVRSRAVSREEYLRRPDLGRRLHPDCQQSVALHEVAPPRRLTVIVGDGLASLAPARHALPLLLALRAYLTSFNSGTPESCAAHQQNANASDWSLDTIFIATGARVALADEIGAMRGAEAVVIMLGERPGLSAPDSLGIYLTYAPRPGRTDAERNCISNIRDAGLSYEEAAYKLHYLLHQCRLAGFSGVNVRDSSEWPPSRPSLS